MGVIGIARPAGVGFRSLQQNDSSQTLGPTASQTGWIMGLNGSKVQNRNQLVESETFLGAEQSLNLEGVAPVGCVPGVSPFSLRRYVSH